ncbi:MAG: TauD/TfdA family dioxygenase [Waddliaceae bacterium]
MCSLFEYCEGINNWVNPYHEQEKFLEMARQRHEDLLIHEVKYLLHSFKERATEKCYLYFSGLPVDQELIQTVTLELPVRKKSFISEFCLATFATFLGEPFNYIQEESGNLYRNIRPQVANVDEQTSDSSRSILELHTETAFHPLKPDFLMLYCLRTDRDGQAYTLLSDLSKVLNELDEETILELQKPQFKAGIDFSFGNIHGDKYPEKAEPILYKEAEEWRVTYEHLMIASTSRGEKAIEQMTEAVKKVQEKVLLQPGELLIVDNKRAIHGRTSFHMYGDGYDRWLQRTYVSIDKQFLDSIPNQGRIITKQF